MMKPMSRSIICVDFDGGIYSNMKYQGTTILNGKPVDGAVDALSELAKSSRIIINSSRFEVDEGMEAVREWMISNGMDYELSKHKPNADIYIDDRAVCFDGDWGETIERVRSFRQWQSDEKAMNRIISRGRRLSRGGRTR